MDRRKTGTQEIAAWARIVNLLTLLSFLLSVLVTPSQAAALASDARPQEASALVKAFTPPTSIGQVVDAGGMSATTPVPSVIHIQDLHANYSAQSSIAKLLEYYDRELGAGNYKVAVEGAQGPILVSQLGRISDRALKEDLSDRLMKEAELTGTEYFAIVNGRTDLLWGVEDERYHMANLALFKDTYNGKQQLARLFAELEKQLEPIKNKYYTFAMKKLDRRASAYSAGKVDEYDFNRSLVRRARRQGIAVASRYPEIAKLNGMAPAGPFVDADKLMTEQANLFLEVEGKLAKNDTQRNIVKASHNLDLLKRLTTEEVTTEEVRALAPRLSEVAGQVQQLLDSTHTAYDQKGFAELVNASLDFYAIALLRDQFLAGNALALLKTPKIKTVVLVAGGFHTPGITALLKKEGVSYVTVAPAVTSHTAQDRARYVARLMGHHVNSEQIVSGANLLSDALNGAMARVTFGAFKRRGIPSGIEIPETPSDIKFDYVAGDDLGNPGAPPNGSISMSPIPKPVPLPGDLEIVELLISLGLKPKEWDEPTKEDVLRTVQVLMNNPLRSVNPGGFKFLGATFEGDDLFLRLGIVKRAPLPNLFPLLSTYVIDQAMRDRGVESRVARHFLGASEEKRKELFNMRWMRGSATFTSVHRAVREAEARIEAGEHEAAKGLLYALENDLNYVKQTGKAQLVTASWDRSFPLPKGFAMRDLEISEVDELLKDVQILKARASQQQALVNARSAPDAGIADQATHISKLMEAIIAPVTPTASKTESVPTQTHVVEIKLAQFFQNPSNRIPRAVAPYIERHLSQLSKDDDYNIRGFSLSSSHINGPSLTLVIRNSAGDANDLKRLVLMAVKYALPEAVNNLGLRHNMGWDPREGWDGWNVQDIDTLAKKIDYKVHSGGGADHLPVRSAVYAAIGGALTFVNPWVGILAGSLFIGRLIDGVLVNARQGVGRDLSLPRRLAALLTTPSASSNNRQGASVLARAEEDGHVFLGHLHPALGGNLPRTSLGNIVLNEVGELIANIAFYPLATAVALVLMIGKTLASVLRPNAEINTGLVSALENLETAGRTMVVMASNSGRMAMRFTGLSEDELGKERARLRSLAIDRARQAAA